MPSEIEIKLKVPWLDDARHALEQCGAKRLGKTFETNLFFDRSDRSLLAQDKGLRIRMEIPEGTKEPRGLLTFKGPRRKSDMHNRESYDLSVSPAQDAMGFLRALGFEQTLGFEKRRESWMLDSCHVELDELPFLGTFVEVEGPSEEAVRSVQRKLKLDPFPPLTPTYIALVDAYFKEKGLSMKTLRFP